MLVKMDRKPPGQSSPGVRATIAYLMGETAGNGKKRGAAPVHFGGLEPALLIQLAEVLGGRITSGVVSFVRLPPRPILRLITKEFETVILPARKDRLSICWILHFEHGHPHLHFVIHGIDLQTLTAYTPYLHRLDRRRVDAWKRTVNARFFDYGIGDPDDFDSYRKTKTTRLIGHSRVARAKNDVLAAAEAASMREPIVDRFHLARLILRPGWSLEQITPASMRFRVDGINSIVELRGGLFDAANYFGTEPHMDRSRSVVGAAMVRQQRQASAERTLAIDMAAKHVRLDLRNPLAPKVQTRRWPPYVPFARLHRQSWSRTAIFLPGKPHNET